MATRPDCLSGPQSMTSDLYSVHIFLHFLQRPMLSDHFNEIQKGMQGSPLVSFIYTLEESNHDQRVLIMTANSC